VNAGPVNTDGNTPPAQLIQRARTFEVAAGQTLQQALDSLEIPAELYLAIRDGELLTGEAHLQPGDQVRLVGVVSGG
jgi:sulfur carrier protein ThiS